MLDRNISDIWDKHQRQWSALGPPLRPSREDLEIYGMEIREWCESVNNRGINGFVLGATPEFPYLPWPPGSTVYALDKSVNMLRHIWPSTVNTRTGRVLMTWYAMPIKDGTGDIIIGDGGFSLLGWPDGYRKVLASVLRALSDNGKLIVRFFVRPEKSENAEFVFDDLLNRRIDSFHCFKWRLAMALQGDTKHDIPVSDIWGAWDQRNIRPEYLASRLGWNLDSVRTIEAYRTSNQRLSFPYINELSELLGEQVKITRITAPSYDIGNRCPIISMQKLF